MAVWTKYVVDQHDSRGWHCQTLNRNIIVVIWLCLFFLSYWRIIPSDAATECTKYLAVSFSVGSVFCVQFDAARICNTVCSLCRC